MCLIYDPYSFITPATHPRNRTRNYINILSVPAWSAILPVEPALSPQHGNPPWVVARTYYAIPPTLKRLPLCHNKYIQATLLTHQAKLLTYVHFTLTMYRYARAYTTRDAE